MNEPARARLLGGVDLRLGDQRVALDSARAESLLAYLLLHRDAPQQRQRLAFMLWPDSTEQQARTNLRHVLHNLRRTLPGADRFIEVTPRTLGWRSDAPLWLDVAAFERALAEGRLDEAVETYRGELLAGNYDDWLLEERERLAQLHHDALTRLARQLEEQGRRSEAIRCAEQLLRRDPLREETYRQLMRLHDADGDRAMALRAYHACATTLVRELGVEPSAETREAYKALLEVSSEPEAPQPAPPAPFGAPLVGRQEERARLAKLWRSAERGSARLVLVTGEAGIGKSRLVEELRTWCAHGGASTAETRAYAAEGAIAYGGLVSWLRSEPIATRLRGLERAHLIELARLLPEVLSEGALAPPEPLPEDEQRQRLFAAAGRAILSAGAPVLLVAEDVQWCDRKTFQFAHFLLRSEPEARLLIAATARREEIDANHPVSELVTALQALDAISEIGLERFGREDTRLLAERVAGRSLAAGEVDRLYEDSEGNPLFVVESLRGEHAAPLAAKGEMSEKVRAVIAARLARLSEPASWLAGVAATIGREFSTHVLADATDVTEDAFVRGLDELWRRGVVRAHGPNAYDFSHAKIRDAAYGSLGPAEARHHHLRGAEALERAHAGDPDAVAGQIAAHREAGGAGEEAIAWHMRAAEAAQRLHASADAVRSLERAVHLIDDLPVGRERDELELRLLTQLPAPLVAIEGYLSDRLAKVHDRALDLAGALAVEPEAPLVRSLAMATLTRGEFEAARPFGEQLRARAERKGDDVLWVESAYVLGVAAYWQGQLATARAEFEAALRRYRPERRSAHLLRYGQDPGVFCQMRLAHTLWLLGHTDAAERERDDALARVEPEGHPFSRTTAAVWAAIIALDQGDTERLCHYVEALSEEGMPDTSPTRIVAEGFAGLVDALRESRGAGIERARAALAESRGGTPAAPGINGILMRILLEACVRAKRADTGLAAAAEALEMGEGAQLWEAEIRRLRAESLTAAGGSREEAEAELLHAIEVAERQGSRPFELRARETLDRLRAGTL